MKGSALPDIANRTPNSPMPAAAAIVDTSSERKGHFVSRVVDAEECGIVYENLFRANWTLSLNGVLGSV